MDVSIDVMNDETSACTSFFFLSKFLVVNEG